MLALSQSTIYFLALIKQYLESDGKNCLPPDFAASADFEEILRISLRNKCDSFIYHTLWKWISEYGVNPAVLKAYKERMLFSAVSQLRADAELKELIIELNSAGIRFLLLKGIVLSNLYPDPAYRRSYDADIHIDEEYSSRVADVLNTRGYVLIPNERVKYEKTYKRDDVLSVEIHTRLFENFYERNSSAIAAVGLESPSSRKEVRVLDTIAETLAPNHFLVYVICHHTKHFIASGINLRHLVDICVYVNKYHEKLDWEFITVSLKRFGIVDFALYLLYICQHYLGMTDVSFLYQDIEEDVVAMLIYDIVERSADSDGVIKRAAAHDIVHEAYFKNGKNNVLKFKYFPRGKSLSRKYLYAKRHPVLLPVAWIHRALSYLWRKMRGQKVISPGERAQLAKERVELLKLVRIL